MISARTTAAESPTAIPGCGCGRFVEIWNLVFTQFNQDENKVRTPLPRPNIDTGMGLERLTTVMQGKSTVYDTDIFTPLLDKLAVFAGKNYGQNEETDNCMRVVVEHSRAIAFVIADGVMPANDGRGYVLRRLLRRAALFRKTAGHGKTLPEADLRGFHRAYEGCLPGTGAKPGDDTESGRTGRISFPRNTQYRFEYAG